MSTLESSGPIRKAWWPYVVLMLAAIPAVWHVLDFDEDVDPEFPAVTRPVFSRYPPAAYRLAEPGDTLDRIVLYLASLATVVSAVGAIRGRGRGLWLAGVAVSLAALWHGATPWPTVDGWHGWGFRAMADPAAPAGLRVGLALGTLALAGLVAGSFWTNRARLHESIALSRARGDLAVWIVAFVFLTLRLIEVPDVEPFGYWPRVCFIEALLAANSALVVALLPSWKGSRRGLLYGPLAAVGWFVLVAGGVWLTWYHRPLARFKVVEPGRIYLSAMPTRRGLEVAQERRHFKTIINLFPEDTPLRSPILPDELAFARTHGIHYVGSPSDPSELASSRFLDETLRLAQDPSAWPILVHCHGCMDRSPAWMGIYRFLVQGRPLGEAMKEIERHRGYRPKASVVLLYNRVLRERGGERYWHDPAARLLRECGNDLVVSPGGEQVAPGVANPEATARLSNGGEARSRE